MEKRFFNDNLLNHRDDRSLMESFSASQVDAFKALVGLLISGMGLFVTNTSSFPKHPYNNLA